MPVAVSGPDKALATLPASITEPVIVAGNDGRVVGAVDGDRKGLIGRERAVRHRDGEVCGRGRRQRIDRVIIRNERIGAGRAVDEKRAIGTNLRDIICVTPFSTVLPGGSPLMPKVSSAAVGGAGSESACGCGEDGRTPRCRFRLVLSEH